MWDVRVENVDLAAGLVGREGGTRGSWKCRVRVGWQSKSSAGKGEDSQVDHGRHFSSWRVGSWVG